MECYGHLPRRRYPSGRLRWSYPDGVCFSYLRVAMDASARKTAQYRLRKLCGSRREGRVLRAVRRCAVGMSFHFPAWGRRTMTIAGPVAVRRLEGAQDMPNITS